MGSLYGLYVDLDLGSAGSSTLKAEEMAGLTLKAVRQGSRFRISMSESLSLQVKCLRSVHWRCVIDSGMIVTPSSSKCESVSGKQPRLTIGRMRSSQASTGVLLFAGLRSSIL